MTSSQIESAADVDVVEMVVFMGDNWIATEMTSCTNPAAVSSVGTATTIGAGVCAMGKREGVTDGTAVVVILFLAMVGATVATGDSVVEGVVTTAGDSVVTTATGATLTTGDSVDGSTMGAAVGGATTILHWEQSPKTTNVRVKTSAEPSFKQV